MSKMDMSKLSEVVLLQIYNDKIMFCSFVQNFVQLNKMTAASCIRKDPSDKYRPATSRPSTGKIPK